MDRVIAVFRSALEEWEAASPGDPQSLIAVEALSASCRDRGQYTEAEPLFLRALRLREALNGPGSAEVIPAVDSLACTEFGLKKFAEAEQCARDALVIRASMRLASLNQTGRVLLMEAKLPQTEDLNHQAAEIGDLSKAADADMDPVLRTYARMLRERRRNTEAAAMEKRVKEALIRKSDR